MIQLNYLLLICWHDVRKAKQGDIAGKLTECNKELQAKTQRDNSQSHLA